MYSTRTLGFSFVIILLFLPIFVDAQIVEKDWIQNNDKSLSLDEASAFSKLPSQYLNVEIVIDGFQVKLKEQSQEIILPNPAGKFQTYVIKPSYVNAPEVADLYTIKTFTGYLKSNPTIMIACDISPSGFHAAVYNGAKTFFISPIRNQRSAKHLIYYKTDHLVEKAGCQVKEIEKLIDKSIDQKKLIPTQKRTYRLAVSASGEYGQEFGGNPYSATNVINAISSGINMLNPIYLRDLGIEFTNVTNADIVFQNPTSDPYFKPANAQNEWDGHSIDQLATTLSANLGNANFDVGHLVVWANVGGLAGPNPCNNNSKAGGYSGADGSIATLWIDFVAHELGHQFGMPHNFSNSCDGNGEADFRYEPGEGSSIMSYANVCGIGYAQASDPFFAITSINAAQSYINGHTCPAISSAGNIADPVITQPVNLTVPKETPFILVGAASDANDPIGNLTYAWEQNDGDGPATTGMPSGMLQKEPLFRFRPASSDNFRHFPELMSSLTGTNLSDWERLSSVARTIKFSLTVRDNNTSFGRLSQANNTVTVANTGPFNVISPNGGETLSGSTQVNWSENGTSAHCPNVDILVSIDGGNSFVVVADGIANDGSELITFPGGTSTSARVLVRCDVSGGFRAASTFYDVSDANFSIANGGGCNVNETVSTATITGNTLASAIISTQGSVEASGAIFSAPMVNLNSDFSVPAGQCFEVNNVGCGFTGTLNCGGGSGTGSGTCASPYVLTCGTSFMGDTNNGTNTWNGYPNGADFSGKETIHTITVPANSSRNFNLTSSASNTDLDLFISTANCDSSPEYFSENSGNNESITIPAQSSQITYFIIVDDYFGGTGAYTLTCN